jgi:hypothetical protein
MAGGDAALREERHRELVEATRVRVFSIENVVLVASLVCSWPGRPLAVDCGLRGSSSHLLLLPPRLPYPFHGRWQRRAYLSALKNKGVMAMLIFEHRVLHLFHAVHLELDAAEFRSFSRRFPQFDAWRH